jgi:hypothetical protein
MKNKTEIAFSASLLEGILKKLPRDTILVGGQSRGFWMS